MAGSANTTFSGVVSGAGSLAKDDASTLTLSGVDTYTGGTTVTGGRLIDLNPHGDYAVAQAATLELRAKSDQTYSGVVSGAGTLVKSGVGTLTLTQRLGLDVSIESGTLKASTQNLGNRDIRSTGGTLQSDQATAGRFNAAYTGAGALLKTGAGNLTMVYPLSNTGGVHVAGGTLTTEGGGTIVGGLAVDAEATLVGSGFETLTVVGATANQGRIRTLGSTVFTGPVTGAGGFTGAGKVMFDGGYSPGDSPASITFAGALAFGATNDLTMELGGTALGTEYDHLDVLGDVSFGGNLRVTILNGFSAGLGQSFDLFDFRSSNGLFASVSLPTLSEGLGWDTSALYTTGVIRTQAVPEPASFAALGVGLLAFTRRRKGVGASLP